MTTLNCLDEWAAKGGCHGTGTCFRSLADAVRSAKAAAGIASGRFLRLVAGSRVQLEHGSHAFGRILHLNRWLAEWGWSLTGKLSRNEVEGFVAVYPERCGCRGVQAEHLKRMGHSLNRLVEFLRQRGLFDSLPEVFVYQPLLGEYLRWMREHQHAARGTIELRRRGVSHFLTSLGEDATVEGLAKLDAQRVEAFFIGYAEGRARPSRRCMQAALRTSNSSLFFLCSSFNIGNVSVPLATCHCAK